MTIQEQLNEKVLDEATDWLVILNSGEVSDEQYQQFEQWKQQKPENALAIEKVTTLISSLSELPACLKSESFTSSKHKFNQTLKHNTILSLSSLFIISCIVYQLPWTKWQADYHTDVGEIKNLKLNDGSQLTLASNSYINIHFSKNTRMIELVQGEIYIATAHDQQKRPFFVKTEYGQMQALGTEFTVRHENHKTKLNVYQHAVAIHTHDQKTPQVIQQGYRTVFDNTFIAQAIPLKNDRPYWTQHLLVVENWPLKKVLNELYRYKKGHYFIDSRIENLPISGVFSLANIPQSLESLAYTHRLKLDFYSPYMLYVKK
ncbi:MULTISPECIES: FecR domain-containing protein [unclassified Acinetobacter]|uniref:FecR domain-containing protein n=1 Tax=unclassified Acinetobacter TaxID=196816 RepID=UPI002934F08C|nr:MULTISPECIES: FecR domain-containing protein [unclassified Acinetobacter]WOE31505.1 FecR domain-containing protein [Acinetobacter sp. SAAs470]WOE39701.1 FecR domain-containing protein [Acinetobacter sp. SAAs474]